MVMTLKHRIRQFLGIDALPSRSEIIEIRQLIESNQREILENFVRLKAGSETALNIQNYRAPSLDWDTFQRNQLAEMLSKPPKED